MSVGQQPSSNDINMQLTALAIQMRKVMQSAADLSTYVNGQGNGQATLQALGYSAADATSALSMISYLNTVASVYFGTAAQATAFNFNQELSQLWAGQ